MRCCIHIVPLIEEKIKEWTRSQSQGCSLSFITAAAKSFLQLRLHNSAPVITSGGQVTFKKQLSYFTSVTCKSNSLLLICYPFFIVTVPLQLLPVVTDILNVTK
jgi:hypothetical protein